MTTSESKPGERVADVRFDDDTMSVDLADGRTITVPLAWYPRLLDATPAGGMVHACVAMLLADRKTMPTQARAWHPAYLRTEIRLGISKELGARLTNGYYDDDILGNLELKPNRYQETELPIN